ncbi:triple gene block 1 [Daphne virus S]|uniref:Triple gene block 1 n=1 Tax=Daphne virus S TaxID=216614 RepID=Q5GR22_9VIRU|nr:triple gene block 1 [Daphne virus S]CAF04327.1 triple gene block 1 [Daphne virus S]
MDLLVDVALEFGFTRVSSVLRSPVIFHCVPGAGKSTLIRELINRDHRFIAFTAGEPDPPNLSGRAIKKYIGSIPKDRFVLLDEYNVLESIPDGVYACFGDPLQVAVQRNQEAHFVCNFSRRFGSATAQFLRGLGFEIAAEGQDTVEIRDIYAVDPKGQIVFFERSIGCLLKAHSVEAKHISEIRGQTFDHVTFVTESNDPRSDLPSAFQCLTRHRVSLLVLTPNATYSTA